MSEEGKQEPRWRAIAFVVTSLAIFVFASTFLTEMFEIYVSRGLAFVLMAAAMMLIVVALGSLFGLRRSLMPADDRRSKDFPVLPVLVFFMVIAAAASWGALAYIETNALSQPDHATGAFTVAVHLKGVVRFMTPDQYRIDQIANWTFLGCVLGPLGIGLVLHALRRMREDRS